MCYVLQRMDPDPSRMFGAHTYHLTAPWLTRTARPKPIYLWTVQDVQKWLRRHCSEYYPLYAELFLNNDITGRTLLRITEGTLLRMGISNMEHRQEVWREITKLRLKSDIVEIRDLERKDENV